MKRDGFICALNLKKWKYQGSRIMRSSDGRVSSSASSLKSVNDRRHQSGVSSKIWERTHDNDDSPPWGNGSSGVACIQRTRRAVSRLAAKLAAQPVETRIESPARVKDYRRAKTQRHITPHPALSSDWRKEIPGYPCDIVEKLPPKLV